MKTCSTLSDDELVRLYENGNDNAFDILLNRHQGKLFNYIYFLTRDEDFANDVFQDTFVRVVTSIRSHNYEATGNFGSWLMRISRNLVLDHQRHMQVASLVPHECLDENGELKRDLLNNADLCESNIESEIFDHETKESLRELVDSLVDNQREIIYMRFYRDMSFKEIAQVLGVSINTALGRVRYALINLRRMACERHLSLVG